MTAYSFGDVVLVPFPFSNHTESKRRPAVVVSSAAYHQGRPDLILMAVTSQIHSSGRTGEVLLANWKEAGLLKPSVLKPLLFTLDRTLIVRKLGRLQDPDRLAVRRILSVILEMA